MADEPNPHLLSELTWEDAEDAIADADYVVLPTGSTEQHSTHLPLSVDSLRAEHLTRRLVEAAPGHGLSMLALPTLPYGYSEHHMQYAGTVTLQPDTYRRVVVEIGESLAAHGLARLLLLNTHGGNRQPLKLAADRLERDHDLPTHFVNWTDFARERLREEFGDDWGHAGQHETSVVSLFRPELVREERAEPQTNYERQRTRRYAYFDEVTDQGGLGDPTAADPEFVAGVVDETTDRILEALVGDLDGERENHTLPESG